MIIYRDYNRIENDDYKLNVEHHVVNQKESVPIYDKKGLILGWKIQNQYE